MQARARALSTGFLLAGLLVPVAASSRHQDGGRAAPATQQAARPAPEATPTRVKPPPASTPPARLPATRPGDAPAPAGTSLIASISPTLARVLTIYGALRVDLDFDSARSAGGGNWVFWVLRNHQGQVGSRTISDGNHAETNVHARNTRFGLKLDSGRVELIRASLKGQLELDFFGGDTETATWKALPRLRIGAVTIDWGFFEVMGGNHWDTFSTLVPTTLDGAVLWWSGNLGARRPQLRVTFKPRLGRRVQLLASAAVARAFDVAGPDYDGLGRTMDRNGDGAITPTDEYGRPTGEVLAPGNGTNDGEDSGLPQLQWRLGIQALPAAETGLLLALGGHVQRAVVSTPAGTSDRASMISWSVGGELVVPLGSRLALRGEVFYGENLKDVMGGAGQDLNPASGDEIAGLGFWAELTGRVLPCWTLAAGFAGDYPVARTLEVATASQLEALRFSNQSVYATTQVALGAGAHAGLGYHHAMTGYRISRDATTLASGYESHVARNNRVMVTLYYAF